MEENGILLNDRIKSLATLGESAQTEFKSAKGGFPVVFGRAILLSQILTAGLSYLE